MVETLPAQQVFEAEDGIIAVVHEGGVPGVANSTCIFDSSEALVVDTLLLPEWAELIGREIRSRGARPRGVINTHHHIDHVGGNSAFPDVPVLAHPVTVNGVARVVHEEPPFGRLLPPYGSRVVTGAVRIPEPLSASEVDVPQDGRLLVLGAAHSPQDLAVWVPRTRVLIAGDLCFNGVVPLALHGDIPGWIAALGALVALGPAVVVPGHGPLATISELLILRTYLEAVWEVAVRAVDAQACLEDALAALDPGPVGDWHATQRTALNLEAAMAAIAGVPLTRPW